MSTIINEARFAELLKKDFDMVKAQTDMKRLDGMIDTFFTRKSTDRAFEEYYTYGRLPEIQLFDGKFTTGTAYAGYKTKVVPADYGLAVPTERRFLETKQYGVFDDIPKQLMDSSNYTKGRISAGLFNGAFSATPEFGTNEEGKAMCSDTHLTKSGDSTATGFDNAGTTALSRTSLRATRLLMRGFRDDRGARLNLRDDFTIVCPDALGDTAKEIVGTDRGYETANGTTNVDYKRYGIVVHPWLDDTDTNNWFLVDLPMLKSQSYWVSRIDNETDVDYDKFTRMFHHFMFTSFGYCFGDWRSIYGHQVA